MIFGSHVIFRCWCTVFYQVQSQRSRLPGRFGGLHASFCWQALWRFWFHFPARIGTLRTNTWFNDDWITVLHWPANSPDLNPIENVWVNIKRQMNDMRHNNADELMAAIKATWALITPQQVDRLIHWSIYGIIHTKGGQTKYWVHIPEHTFQKADISVCPFFLSFFLTTYYFWRFLRFWIFGFHELQAIFMKK